MTAIFAYVKGPCAVIAADSCRADPTHLLPQQTVSKVYCWADRIPFACTGNGGFMSKLAADILALASSCPADLAGFRHAFKTALKNNSALLQASASKSASLAGGTILASVPEEDGSPAQIWQLECSSGREWPHASDLSVQGTDPETFRTIGLMKYHEHKKPTGLASDVWAVESIALASDICGQHVGLPCDVIITRPDPTGQYQSLKTRFTSPNLTPNPAFQV